LRKDNKAHIKKGLPGLMDIPFIGGLFSSQSDTLETTEIVIFITPHIMTGDENHSFIKGAIKPRKELDEDAGMAPALTAGSVGEDAGMAPAFTADSGSEGMGIKPNNFMSFEDGE